MNEWIRAFDLDDTLAEKRAAIERLHRDHLRTEFQEWIDNSVFPARLLEPMLTKAMALAQPAIDEDLARLVGRDKLN